MGELLLLFDRGFGGTETCPCSQGLGWVCSLTHMCTYPLHAPWCPLGQGQDPVSEVLGSDPLSTTPYLFQALFHFLWECGSCVKAEKQYQQPSKGQGFPCTVGCGSAVLYSITGRRNFASLSIRLCLLGQAQQKNSLLLGCTSGPVPALLHGSLHLLQLPCAALRASPPCASQGWEAAELSLSTQQVSTAPLGQRSAALRLQHFPCDLKGHSWELLGSSGFC